MASLRNEIPIEGILGAHVQLNPDREVAGDCYLVEFAWVPASLRCERANSTAISEYVHEMEKLGLSWTIQSREVVAGQTDEKLVEINEACSRWIPQNLRRRQTGSHIDALSFCWSGFGVDELGVARHEKMLMI